MLVKFISTKLCIIFVYRNDWRDLAETKNKISPALPLFLKESTKQSAIEKLHITWQQKKDYFREILGKFIYVSIYIYRSLTISGRHLQLRDCVSCLFSSGKITARQHVQHGKNSRKSQSNIELIKQKTKGHLCTSFPLLPYSLMGPVSVHTQKASWTEDNLAQERKPPSAEQLQHTAAG